jgi:type I restriction enzyme S subunit
MRCKTVTLSDVAVGGGSYGIAASAVPYSENLPTYLRITDINDNGTINFDGLKSVAAPDASRYCLAPNDIVFARTGASTGRNYFYDGTDGSFVYAGFLIKFSVDPKKINPLFVKYYCQSKDYFDWVASFNTGSTRGNINAQTLGDMPIPLLEREQQDFLVRILSSLDAKIANNKAINHHLEQMAQAIFKSWFVDFEPFGGKMPEDWREGTLGELCGTITKGTTPTTLKKQFITHGVNFVKAESILDDHSLDFGKLAFIDDETNTLLSRSIIQENDILFTIAGTLGRFAHAGADLLPANTNQAVAIIRADTSKINPATLYSFFIGGLHTDFYTKNIQQAVQANLSLTTIKTLPLFLPPMEAMSEYTALIEPLFEQIFRNQSECRYLATIRDTFLPRLMSGELSIADIDNT